MMDGRLGSRLWHLDIGIGWFDCGFNFQMTFLVSGVSPAAGLKSGQSNRKRDSSMTNVECRLIRRRRIELRNSFYFICYKEQSEAPGSQGL